jgi:hypothetical protein
MRPLSWSTLSALSLAAAALATSPIFSTAGEGIQERSPTLEQEIADIEQQIDAVEADAIAGVWGPRAFTIAWPENVEAFCSGPNGNPSSAIGSEVPGPNNTPMVVDLDPEDRARVQSTFDQMAESIAAFEASAEVSPFSSKFDAFLAGNADLSEAERRGYELFNGQAKCSNCHVDSGRRALFTGGTGSSSTTRRQRSSGSTRCGLSIECCSPS